MKNIGLIKNFLCVRKVLGLKVTILLIVHFDLMLNLSRRIKGIEGKYVKS